MRRLLMLADREEISQGLAEGLRLKDLEERIGRDPSILSREVRRLGGRASYRAGRADKAAAKARRRPRTCKIDATPGLREHVTKSCFQMRFGVSGVCGC